MSDKSTYDELSDKDFKKLGVFVYKNYGINLYPNKYKLVSSRLKKRLINLGMTSYSEYCDFVLNTEKENKEVIEMINSLSTNKTEFFRENDHFNYISENILPSLLTSSNLFITAWSAGCSSGEEPYSLAMILENHRQSNPGFNYGIVGTDISTNMINKARTAVYQEDMIGDIPFNYRKKYLLRSKDRKKKQVRIIPEIRQKVRFFRNNLINESVPGNNKFDIIFCRNTLIYFDNHTHNLVVKRILEKLSMGGYLFLGHSESLLNFNLGMEHIFPSVYRKKQ